MMNNKLDIKKDKSAPPGFTKTKEYEIFIEWLCTPLSERSIKTIKDLANQLNVSRTTIYDWLRHDQTKQQIDQYIDRMAAEDKILFYNALKENRNNPRMNALWHQLYDWSDHEKPQGTVIINFTILEPEQQKPAEDVAFEDVE